MVAGNFIHLAAISTSNLSTEFDSDNLPIPVPDTIEAAVQCRYVDGSKREIVSTSQGGVTQALASLLVGRNTKIEQGSKVSNIRSRNGTPLPEAPGEYEVKEILGRSGGAGTQYRTCVLQRTA